MKRYIALITIITAFVSACSSTFKPTTPPEFARWYQDCWDDFNQRKWAAFSNCYAGSATSQQPGYGKLSVTGAASIVKAFQDIAKTFPDARGEAQLILVNGTHIAGIYLLKGTHTGVILGPDGKEIPPTNRKIGVLFGHAIEVDPASARIVKAIGVIDGITLENQLGLLKFAGRPYMETLNAVPTIVIAKNDVIEMQSLEAERQHIESWNKHDAAAADMHLSDTYVLHDLRLTMDLHKAEASAMTKAFWTGFSDAKLNASSIWAAGDFVVSVGTFDGTNDGEFAPLRLNKTGRKASLPFVNIFLLQDGKVNAEWMFSDNATFANQLGFK